MREHDAVTGCGMRMRWRDAGRDAGCGLRIPDCVETLVRYVFSHGYILAELAFFLGGEPLEG